MTDIKTQTTQLLPCPFCADSASFGSCTITHGDDKTNHKAFYIQCECCGSQTRTQEVTPLMDEERAKESLSKTWNTRVFA